MLYEGETEQKKRILPQACTHKQDYRIRENDFKM